MRYKITASLLLTIICGCGPALSKQDLGHVVFEDPKVAGDKPYEMPKLNDSGADQHSATIPAKKKEDGADDGKGVPDMGG